MLDTSLRSPSTRRPRYRLSEIQPPLNSSPWTCFRVHFAAWRGAVGMGTASQGGW